MSPFDPKELLGKTEDDHLEFKEAEALRRPATIAREVVGFLNADGGHIWIGVKEEAGRAIELQTIPTIDRALRSLLDHLVEIVEPQFKLDEVELTSEGGLIHVSVRKKGHNPPYAQRDGGRRFLIRIADRLREMSREEIARAFQDGSKKKDLSEEALSKTLETVRMAQHSEALAKPQLWLRLVPTESLKIDFTDKPTKKRFETWLMDPTATGNRRSGWDFANEYKSPCFKVDYVEHGDVTDYMRTWITEHGQITFTLDVFALEQRVNVTRHFIPFALLEYPVSVFRLVAEILRSHAQEHADLRVVAGLVIKGIRGWLLKPGSPREPVRSSNRPKAFEGDVLEIDPERLVFDAGNLKENPDNCGLSLVRLIYRSFGFDSDAIPREFDQKQGVLLLE
jgi:hypothetical protein